MSGFAFEEAVEAPYEDVAGVLAAELAEAVREASDAAATHLPHLRTGHGWIEVGPVTRGDQCTRISVVWTATTMPTVHPSFVAELVVTPDDDLAGGTSTRPDEAGCGLLLIPSVGDLARLGTGPPEAAAR